MIERWFAISTDMVVTLKQRPRNPLPNAPTLFVTRKHCMIKHLPLPTSNHQKHHTSHSHYFRLPTYAKAVKVSLPPRRQCKPTHLSNSWNVSWLFEKLSYTGKYVHASLPQNPSRVESSFFSFSNDPFINGVHKDWTFGTMNSFLQLLSFQFEEW